MRTSLEKGRIEGRKEGEVQKAHDVAEALLEEGMEIEKIAKIAKDRKRRAECFWG